MKLFRKVGIASLAFATMFSTLSANVTFSKAAGYVGQLKTANSAVVDQKDNNIVYVSFNDDVAAKITFLEDDIFRYNVDPTGEYSEYCVANSANHMGRIPQYPDNSDEYSKPGATVSEKDGYIIVSNGSTEILFEKATAKMKVVAEGEVVMEEKEALTLGTSTTTQTLVKHENENFYGGGTQNGRFVHTGESINIKNESSWTDGGVSSPNPFYYTTNGYGVLRNTFRPGVYDFGKTTSDTVTTVHNEAELDAYYFVTDETNTTRLVQALLDNYYHVTGNPVLLPEYAFYEGVLNAYNRDSWSATSGSKEWTIKGNDPFSSKGITNFESGMASGYRLPAGAQSETLNGERPTVSIQNYPSDVTTPHKYSAQAVIEKYEQYDMPLGYFLPNDGYGCGYGQNGYYVTGGVNPDGTSSPERLAAVAANVQNLKKFTDFSNAKGIATGLWTQSYLVPDSNANSFWHLLRDFKAEVETGGVTTLKTDVAWVGHGYSMQLDGVKTAYDIVTTGRQSRPNIISLDGWAGSHRYNSVWTGDQYGGEWEYIRFHIPTYIGQSLGGNPNIGSDMDGIFGGHEIIATRDYQWKTFTPQMLNMDGWGKYEKAPFTFGEPYTGISRMYNKLKAQLMPYSYTTAYAAANIDVNNDDTGLPMVRAMFLAYPEDSYTYSKDMQYQFMWGDSFLVAPVYQDTAADENGNDVRNNIYLPDADQIWIDYLTGKQYQGGQVLNNYDAPLWKLPVFVKNGAIIPMYTENNNPEPITETNPNGLDKANRIIEFYPAGSTQYTVVEDDGDYVENTITEVEGYGKVESINYGSRVETLLTSEVEGDTATLTINKAEGTYNGFDKNKNTTFVVNVSKEPTKVTATNGAANLTIEKVTSKEAFDAATVAAGKAVYFYDAAPVLESYGSETLAETLKDVEVSPKLYVKFAEFDATSGAQKLVVEGFENDGNLPAEKLNPNLDVPANFDAPQAKIGTTFIGLVWDAVTGAENYEIEVNGTVYSVGNTTAFTLTDLAFGTDYTFRIRARNAEGYSEWSEELTVRTLLDPWRNVPTANAIWSYGDSWGKLENAFNHVTTDMFHSTDAVTRDQAMILDYGQAYSFEKFEYYPRPDLSNGTVKQMNIYTSLDGVNWKLAWDGANNASWAYMAGATAAENVKTVDLKGVNARYIKVSIVNSVGGFFAAAELAAHKVDGTKAFEVGSTLKNSSILEGDLSNLKNYMGVSKAGDATNFNQIVAGDINYNEIYDVYDYAFTLFKLNGGTKKTGSVSGNAMVLASAETVKAGDTFTLDVYTSDVKNLNGIGSIITFDKEKIEFVNKSQAYAITQMEDLTIDKAYDNGVAYVNVAYANLGNQELHNGTGVIASITLKAKEDISLTDKAVIDYSQVTLVGPDYSTKVCTAGVPVIPEGDVSEIKYTQNDFSFALTNDVLKTDNGTNVEALIQQKSYDALFNGTIERGFEFLWDIESNYVDGQLPAHVVLPTTLTSTFKKASQVSDVKVYNANAANGFVTEASIVFNYEDGTSSEKQTLTVEKADNAAFNFVNPDYAKKVASIAVTFEKAITSKGEDVKNMLTLGEMEIINKSEVAVQEIVLGEGNTTELYVGGLGNVVAQAMPANTSYKYFKATTSDKDIVSVITLADETGAPVYKVRGMKPGTATITLTSSKDPEVKVSYDVTVLPGADKTILVDTVNKYKDITGDIYTTDTFEKLAAALTEGLAVLAKEDATNDEVTEAIKAIQNAYKGLKEIPLDESTLLDNSGFTAEGLYSESNTVDRIFDENMDTFYETPYYGNDASLPKDVIVDLHGTYQVNYVKLFSSNILNGGITNFDISLSMDGEAWDKVYTGEVDAENYKVGTNYAANAHFALQEAKFIKVTINGAAGRIPAEDNIYARIAEMQVYGKLLAADVINPVSVSLDKSSAELTVGETVTLTADVLPVDATDKKVTWSSSNEEIATVENGVVKAVKAGTATITVTTANGLTDTCTITVKAKAKPFPFEDVFEGQWYYEHINEAYQLGLMTGATETLFKPTVSMNRGMVAIVLHRMEGEEKVPFAPIFPDVYDQQYFTTAVMWAKQTGIITGYNNGTFMPLKEVTREEMATMIQRFAKYKGLDVTSSKDITYFQDYADISTYAKAPIQWCVENGVLSGKFEGTKVDPLGTATRAECAKMLSQAYKAIYK